MVVTHARLGQELVGAAEFILGKVEGLEALSVEANHEPSQIRDNLASALSRLSNPDGVLVLTDMFGGTPNNTSLAFLEKDKVEVLTGVNLPMIIKALDGRKQLSLSELASQVCQAGKEAISVAGEILGS